MTQKFDSIDHMTQELYNFLTFGNLRLIHRFVNNHVQWRAHFWLNSFFISKTSSFHLTKIHILCLNHHRLYKNYSLLRRCSESCSAESGNDIAVTGKAAEHGCLISGMISMISFWARSDHLHEVLKNCNGMNH